MRPVANKPGSKGMRPVWWIASLVFHALLLGWLIFFSPVRIIELGKKPTDTAPNISPARAQQVMEKVREQQASSLAEEVRGLEEARRELATLEAQKRDELRQTMTNAPVSLEKILAAQTAAAKSQTAAQEALKLANEQLPANTPDRSSLSNLTAAIREAQAGASQSPVGGVGSARVGRVPVRARLSGASRGERRPVARGASSGRGGRSVQRRRRVARKERAEGR